MLYVAAVFLALLGSVGPVLLKAGALTVQPSIERLTSGHVLALFSILFNPKIFFGLFMYFIGAILWILLLSRYKLSVVYPLVSLNYLFTALLAMWVFHETITLDRWVGIAIVTAGVAVISISSK